MAHIPPPAVADPKADACLNQAYDGGHAIAENRVARSNKRRKMADALYKNGGITEAENGQQQIFHLQQTTSGLPPGAIVPGAPAWFGPAMAAALAAALAPTNNRLDNIENRLNNIEARQVNSTVLAESDALRQLQDGAGNVAPNFPLTLRQLSALTNAQRGALLAFYGLPQNPAATREHRFKQFIGIRP